ncbi:Exosc4, partial [Symbiodinium sp. KB8]
VHALEVGPGERSWSLTLVFAQTAGGPDPHAALRLVAPCLLRGCMTPFALPERRKHRVGDRRLAEIGLAVRRSLPQAVMSHLYPRSEVRLHLQILTSDGGDLAACVTAATLAVMDAGVAMTDFVVGCTAAVVDGRVLMDPTQAEASAATAVIHLAVLPRSRRVVLCQVASRIAADELRDAVGAASDGAVGVFGVVKAAVHDHAVKRLSKRGLLTA